MLPGGGLTDNTFRQRVRIPQANFFTPEILLNLLELERISREGQVT
jgi:hypothetical protein